MTTIPVAAANPSALRPRRRHRRDRRPLTVMAIAMTGVCAAIAYAGADARPVVLPLVSLLLLAALYVAAMVRYDGRVPVFELGSMFVLAVTTYGAVPLVNYLAGGLQWTELSDARIAMYAPSPAEVGAFAWQHVALLAAFLAVYLPLRKGSRPLGRSPVTPDHATITAVVALWLALVIYFWILERAFGMSYDQSYGNYLLGIGPTRGRNLPLIVQQVSHNLRSMLTLEKQLLLIILISGWRALKNRLFVVLLLGFEVVMILTRFYGRTELAILLLTAVVLYDRLVRPLSMKLVVLASASMLTALLAYGAVRDVVVARSLQRPLADEPTMATLATYNNEFQVLWGTAFDLHKRRELGTLAVPWQIYWSDVYNVIPSQLLPFQKIDPSLWYMSLLGATDTGFMFGIVSQATLGWGSAELVLRGALLGLILASIHRWYLRHQRHFWPTALYVFVLVWLFYSVRSTMLYWTYFVLYAFVPTMLATVGLALLLRKPLRLRARRRRPEVR
jgi:hypothetical protein